MREREVHITMSVHIDFGHRMTELDFVKFLLNQMEPLKDHPDRDKYCYNFDTAYEERKQWYKKLTGKEWPKE